MIKMKHVNEARDLIKAMNDLNEAIKLADKGEDLEVRSTLNKCWPVKVASNYILYALYPQREAVVKRLIEIGVDIKE